MLIAGVDIGGTKIAVGVVDETGRVRARTECPTEAERGFADGLRRIITMLRDVEARSGGRLAGVGIGCTGPVYPQRGTIGAVEFLPGWEGAPIVIELERALDLPVAMENDADAAALGEWRWGTGRGTGVFLYVTLSTGIGGGLIVGGRLYRGVDGAHPEIGHHVIDPSGPLCTCGARGCWESLASGSAMERWFREHAPPGHGAAALTAREICARRDDPHARAAVARTGRYIGLGVANLITLFTPDVLALGGGLMRSAGLFWPHIRQVVRSSCAYVPRERVHIVTATLGNDVGIIGAACVWLSHYAKGEKL